MELDREIVRAYAQTFINRRDMYPMQIPDGTYVSVKKKLDIELLQIFLIHLTLVSHSIVGGFTSLLSVKIS